MSKINSRSKGQRGEREIVATLQEVIDRIYGPHDTERPILQRNTIQSDKGGYDLVGLPWFAPEVKHCETFQLDKWWQQCRKQAKQSQFPALFYRRNHIPWRVRVPGWIGADAVGLPAIVDISLEDFKFWFGKRLIHEKEKLT